MTAQRRSPFAASKVRIILLLVLILMGALIAVLRLGGRSVPPPASMTPRASMPGASHPAEIQPASSVTMAKPDEAGGVQICGFGKVAINQDDAGALQDRVGELTKGTASRWLAALQNSGDLRARAAGLLLEGKVTGGEPLRPVTEQTRDAIAQLAAGTVEPAVYAVAMSMCGKYSGTAAGGACQQISLQRWTQIDPGNAVPWLLLADDAQRRHNVADEANAFAHAANSTKVDAYGDSLYAFAAPELPPDVTPLERDYFATEVMGVEAAMATPHYGIAGRLCSVEAMRDSKVRQQCSSLAELLVNHGSDLLDLAVGKAIGIRAGWTSARVNELAQHQYALMEIIRELAPAADADWTCEAVSRVNAYMDQRVRVGEAAAANDLLERSGGTVPELAQRYRQFLDDMRRNAERQDQ